jgi:hypothetical protein
MRVAVARERRGVDATSAATQLGWRGRGHWMRKDRILLHPDPEVVCRLLRGPALRLGDALVIASRRPTTDAIVGEIT